MTSAVIEPPRRVIVAPTTAGMYEVTFKPFCSCPALERVYAAAWDALEYAELLNLEFGWTVLDRTGEAA